MLATFPPTACGIATFSAALCTGLETLGAEVEIVRVGDGLPTRDPRVVAELIDGSAASRAGAVRALNDVDIAIVQHEYGIYGGPDGDELVEILAALDTPPVVVAHTVLLEPTTHQRVVLEAVAGYARTVVVMTESARVRLTTRFDVDPDKVVLVPHGAALGAPSQPHQAAAQADPLLVTWGLLGPGKGVEWVLDALSMIDDVRPRPQYLIAGRTHPKVLAAQGEAYRDMLGSRARTLGVGGSVSFDPTYRDLAGLADLISQASVVVLPYDSVDQVTSGVLVDAVAAGCPVIATAFPHAVELLASGAGIVVPRRDPEALADALRRVLTQPGLRDAMAAEARRLAPDLSWGAVARRYLALGERLVDRREAVAR